MQEYITSRQNPLMVLTAKLLSSSKQRRKSGLYVGEGTKLLNEALRWAPDRLQTVILPDNIPYPALPEHVRQVIVPPRLLEQVSGLETPEGAIFLMELPAENDAELRHGTLILDGIQDPGNLGTILRTADAMNVPVLLTQDCADPYGSKAVRATMGAVFRTTPVRVTRETLIERARHVQIPLIATAISEDASDIRQADLKNAAVVIGSEGRGVSQMLLEVSDLKVVIPMHPRCESLNAATAAAIVLWQMTQL